MNKVCIKISGLNLNRLINKLVDSNILINNLKIKDDSIVFFIDEKNLSILEKICVQERKKFQIISKSSLKNLIIKARYLFGFLLAVILVGCYLLTFNMFIYSLDINGVQEKDRVVIERLLLENGIVVGAKKNLIDTKQIEKLLTQSLENVKGCSIDFTGGRLSVNVFSASEKNNVSITQIKSKYDAIVTKINIKSGESKLKIGDIVKKNDVLISDKRKALGEVFGKVCFVATKIYNEKQILQIPTGKIEEYKTFKYNDKVIYKTLKSSKYSNYITEKCVFYILENYFIPLKCEVYRYVEIENVQKNIPFSEVENQIKKELYDEALLSIKDLNTITNVSYSVIEDNGMFKVDCFVECEINLFE